MKFLSAEDPTRYATVETIYPVDIYPDRFAVAHGDLVDLEARGLVDNLFTMAGGSLSGLHTRITSAGRDLVERIEASARDVAALRRAARVSLLQWLYNRNATLSTKAGDVPDFVMSAEANYFGAPFDVTTVDEAAAHLHEAGLIEGSPVAEFAGPTSCWLTSDGIACAEDFDYDLRGFLGQGNPTPPAQTINFHGSTVNFATGDGALQTINVGSPAEDLLLLVQGIAAIMRDELKDSALDEAAAAAEADLQKPEPSVSGIQRFAAKAKAAAKGVAEPARAHVLGKLIDLLLRDADTWANNLGHVAAAVANHI